MNIKIEVATPQESPNRGVSASTDSRVGLGLRGWRAGSGAANRKNVGTHKAIVLFCAPSLSFISLHIRNTSSPVVTQAAQ